VRPRALFAAAPRGSTAGSAARFASHRSTATFKASSFSAALDAVRLRHSLARGVSRSINPRSAGRLAVSWASRHVDNGSFTKRTGLGEPPWRGRRSCHLASPLSMPRLLNAPLNRPMTSRPVAAGRRAPGRALPCRPQGRDAGRCLVATCRSASSTPSEPRSLNGCWRNALAVAAVQRDCGPCSHQGDMECTSPAGSPAVRRPAGGARRSWSGARASIASTTSFAQP
jgi:hypothetical protein